MGRKVRLIPLASTCPAAWRCLMRHVSLRPSSFALPLWLRPRSNGHKRMPQQNRLRPSPRSRRKICRRAMGEEGGESLDHLVGNREQRRRDFEAERLSRFAVKDEFELVHLLDRQLSGFDALKNATHVNATFVIAIPKHRSVAHQAADFDVLANFIEGGD